jgi:hemerythrin-like domain-containing protein
MSDAVQMLEEQHAEATALVMKLERLTDPTTLSQIFRTLDSRLRDHAAIEEQLFYPAFREQARTQTQADEIAEAIHEHNEMKAALTDLERTSPADPSFKSKLATLKSLVAHHVREEESEILPQARRLFSQQRLDELALKMAKLMSLHSSVYEMA